MTPPSNTVQELVFQLEHTVVELQVAQSINVARLRREARDTARDALLAYVAAMEGELVRLRNVVGMVGEPEVYVPTHTTNHTRPIEAISG